MQGRSVLEAAEKRLALGVGGLLEDRSRSELHGAVYDGVRVDNL